MMARFVIVPGIMRDVASAACRSWRLWLIQLVANLLLFLLLAAWLLIPVANSWQLALNALLAILFAVALLVLHAGTLNYFYDAARGSSSHLRSAFLRAWRHVLPIAIWVAIICLLFMLVDRADTFTYRESVPAYLRSVLPVLLRRHIALSFLMSAYEWIVFTLRWILVPGLLLPFLLSVAEFGFRGFGTAGFVAWTKAIRSLTYWLVLIAAAVIGVIATTRLMAMTPDFRTTTLRQETSSLVIRLSLAYILAVSAWVFTCSLVGRVGVGTSGARDDSFGKAGA
jgi:hypothetical protein